MSARDHGSSETDKSTGMAGLSVSGLTVNYGAQPVVHDLDLEIATSSVLGLVGANGAGKTSTLLAIAGLISPTSGSVSYPAARNGVGQIRGSAFAMVFERLEIPRPTWSVRKYLQLFGSLDGASDLPTDTLRALAIEPIMDRKLGALSAGEFKRVELVRTLSREAGLFLLDEPTKDIDLHVKPAVWGEVRRRSRAIPAAVLIASHDPMEVRTLCDEVVVIRSGRVSTKLGREELAALSVEDVERQIAEAM